MIAVKEYFIDRDYTFSYVREDAPGNPFYHCYKLIATNNSTKAEIDTKLRIFIQPYEKIRNPYEKIRNLNVEITNLNNIKHLEKELAITKDETLDLYFCSNRLINIYSVLLPNRFMLSSCFIEKVLLR